jgi:secondary thiamine-phosphate synthase enzyme
MAGFAEISIQSHKRTERIKLDEQIAKFIAESRVKDGVCHIHVPHTTAGVIINEGADPGLLEDITERLSDLVPHEGHYRHIEHNADSHIKAAIVGCSTMVFVRNGAPVLGRWQSIFFCEFDGPRKRDVWLRVTGS